MRETGEAGFFVKRFYTCDPVLSGVEVTSCFTMRDQ
jgi:hypothetical protein